MNEVYPLVYFTHAELNKIDELKGSLEMTESNAKGAKSALESRKRQKMKFLLYDENMSYEGVEADETPFCIGVMDKSDGMVRVLNTSYFIMKPKCLMTEQVNEELGINKQATYSEKLDSLTAAFGSSKKRKAMQTKLKNKIDSETLESAVSEAVEESKKNLPSKRNSSDAQDGDVEEDEQTENENGQVEEFSILPVPNKDAKTPDQVYNLFNILSISKQDMDRYTLELASKFVAASTDTIRKWKETFLYPQYVCERLLILSTNKCGHQYKLIKCKQLAFMAYLIAMFQLKSAQMRSKHPFKATEVPEIVANRLLDQYTVVSASSGSKSSRSMPRRLKDKLTSHILILALNIDEFSTTLDTFQKDLKLSVQRIVDFYQALGCHIKSQVQNVNGKKVVGKLANLSLPLNEMSKNTVKKRARNS
jgi:hypothetical protein